MLPGVMTIKVQALLDGGHFKHMVDTEQHARYWRGMVKEYPNHPLVAQEDSWGNSFGATLYGPLGLNMHVFLGGVGGSFPIVCCQNYAVFAKHMLCPKFKPSWIFGCLFSVLIHLSFGWLRRRSFSQQRAVSASDVVQWSFPSCWKCFGVTKPYHYHPCKSVRFQSKRGHKPYHSNCVRCYCFELQQARRGCFEGPSDVASRISTVTIV